jgi:hypothetical protein
LEFTNPPQPNVVLENALLNIVGLSNDSLECRLSATNAVYGQKKVDYAKTEGIIGFFYHKT